MTRTSLPPGFRFHPTDVELIKYYLKRKVIGKRIRFEVIAEVDIYKFAPWDLPDKSSLRSKDLEWFFFCPREKKYSNGSRMNRATEYGYWKTTGKDRSILCNEQTVGMIKTLIFHSGKAPRGDRTDWVMHEYRLEDKNLVNAKVVQDAYVICKIFQKTGPGPRNGAQYGAPFNEEEWSDDEIESSLFALSAPAPVVQNNEDNSVLTSTNISETTICTVTSSELNPKTVEFSTGYVLGPVQAEDVSMLDNPLISDEDMVSMLECITDDIILATDEDHRNENLDSVDGNGINQTSPLDVNDIFNDLGELGKWPELTENGLFSCGSETTDFATNQRLAFENGLYLELKDLELPLGGPIAPVVPLHHNFYNNNCSESEQPCYPLNYFDAVDHASVVSHHSPVLLEGSYGYENHFNAFQQDNGKRGNVNQGYKEYADIMNNADVAVWNQKDLDSTIRVSQVQTRGRFHYP